MKAINRGEEEGDHALLNEAVENLLSQHSSERYDKYGHADLSEVRPGLFFSVQNQPHEDQHF